MSHLLVVELPGGNDTDILAAAQAGGHRVSFLTADPAHYRADPEVARWIATAEAVIDAGAFELPALLAELDRRHRAAPFDAVLCLQDLRLVEAAEIAAHFGLRHVAPANARLLRDKAAVRRTIAAAGIAQPPCLVAEGAAALVAAVDAIGLPVMVKPVDGFGSQNVFALRDAADRAALDHAADLLAQGPGAYGLGVAARGTMLVERLLEGTLIGCDTMSVDGAHRLLGVNEKLFFAPPSFAIRGGCFSTNVGQFAEIEAHVFALLDAVGFDQGAAHVELMLTADGPVLVEINPRLVGARIGRLIGAARGRPVHDELIALHVGGHLPPPATRPMHAVTRWLAAPAPGELVAIAPPVPPRFADGEVTLCAAPGATVTPPFDNADRLGFVMTVGADRAAATARAEAIVADTRIDVRSA